MSKFDFLFEPTRTLALLIAAISVALPSFAAEPVPTFVINEAYLSLREELLRQGWQPIRTRDSHCARGNRLCQLPEVWWCDLSPSFPSCGFTWEKGEVKIEVVATGAGDNPRVEKINCQTGCDSARVRETFNAINQAGNLAARQGHFKLAVDYWMQAIPLDASPNVPCRGESLRGRIRAANDTISMMQQGNLSQAEAANWFQNRSTELWMPNRCNTP